jgi:hypothetical protein
VRSPSLFALPLALALAACTGGGATSSTGPGPPTGPRTLTYHAGPAFLHLTFEYPRSWTARTTDEQSSFATYLVYLSNQSMVAPCRTTSSGPAGETFSTECGLPVKHLEPGGVLAWWTEWGWPDWSFDKNANGQPLTVAGRRAKLTVTMKPECHRIDGDAFMKTVVERPQAPDNWYEFDACIRGPGVDHVEAQVRALLASTRFGEGA